MYKFFVSMKRLIFVLALILIKYCCYAQKSIPKTLLWEVSGKGLKHPSYIYGTFHLMCPQDMIVTKTLKTYFNQTKQLYLEININDPSVLQQMISNISMKNDSSLTQLISQPQYDSLAARFQKYTGIPLVLMNKMKPFFVLSAVFPSLLECAATDGWEKKFMDMATVNGEKIKGLETVKDQLDVVDSIPYNIQAQMLVNTLMNIDSTKESLKQLVKVYKEKDLRKLYELTKEDEEFAKYDDFMINQRNANWLPVIIKEASVMPTFFAVGAGHLAGEKGILQLLKREGYTVKPVFY